MIEACPGLYLMGLPFLHSISSALLGGVGRDAGHIADHIAGHRVPADTLAASSIAGPARAR